jgi:hypothetical protein
VGHNDCHDAAAARHDASGAVVREVIDCARRDRGHTRARGFPLVVALGVLGTAKAPVPLTDLDVAAMAASALAVVGFWLLVMSVESCLVLSARKTVRVAHAVVVVAHAMTVPVLLIVALGALASALSLTADWVAANQSVWALVVCLLVCLVYLPARTFRRGWKGISEAAAQPPATRDEPTGTP